MKEGREEGERENERGRERGKVGGEMLREGREAAGILIAKGKSRRKPGEENG